MTADLLREARDVMRQRARAATEGPWFADGSEVYNHSHVWVAEGYKDERDQMLADTEHVASWHPLVALAVADWLDTAADQWANYEGSGGVDPEGWPDFGHAATIARTYLGRDG